jgi:hypothetical protein
MVHREQRWRLRRRGQLGVEPGQALRVERPRVLSRTRSLEHDERQRAEIDGVLHGLAVPPGVRPA